MTKELDHMICKFPAHRVKMIELFSISEDFRSLCDDYWQCDSQLMQLRESETKNSRTENSYKMLLLDLEQEVFRFLSH